MALKEALRQTNNNQHLQIRRLASLDHSDLCAQVFEYNFGSTPTANGTSRSTTFLIERLTLEQVEEWGASIYVMSPPCQPHTRQHTNQQQDMSDPRSASFLHLCNLLETMKESRLPRYIFLENVIGFESSNSFQRWRDVLQKRKYHVGHFHLNPTQGKNLF
jgi:tRNA (cytosine38-C5)-methyltransferase